MDTIAVLNAKGGCGKTTIATNLAAWFALHGYRTALGDLDAQRSSRYWLARRPAAAATIEPVKLHKQFRDPPGKTERFLIDCAAAMHRGAIKEVIARADVILVPVLASTYDQAATARLLEHVAGIKRVRKGKRRLAFVANRVRPRTRNARALDDFLGKQQFPTVARLRDTQIYSNAADEGLSLFEWRERRARQYADEWSPLVDYLEDG
jgi:chromosome partitioning protein